MKFNQLFPQQSRKVQLRRSIPDIKQLAPVMKFAVPQLDRRQARLSRAADVEDLRVIARRRTPRAAFDYVDGAALAEVTADRTREDFLACELIPHVLSGCEEVDLRTQVCGQDSALPFGIAPTGFTRFMHSEGEDAGASAAADAGIPFTLSTMGTRSIEEVAAASTRNRSNDGTNIPNNWFQLYLWKDREASKELLDRAKREGFSTLVVTVDTPVAGQRLRDVRNGMRIPPALSLKTVFDASYRPEWWFNFLTTDPLTFASLSDSTGDLPSLINAMFDPRLNLEDLQWIRAHWDGPLLVKGILTGADARRVLGAGADGVVVSSHGGRQLDRSLVPLRQLAEVADAVAEVSQQQGRRLEVLYDSGIRSGTDIAIALALGADFVLVGRAYLYGLMAGGREGVDRLIQLLADELRTSCHLLGVSGVHEIGREHIRVPWEINAK